MHVMTTVSVTFGMFATWSSAKRSYGQHRCDPNVNGEEEPEADLVELP